MCDPITMITGGTALLPTLDAPRRVFAGQFQEFLLWLGTQGRPSFDQDDEIKRGALAAGRDPIFSALQGSGVLHEVRADWLSIHDGPQCAAEVGYAKSRSHLQDCKVIPRKPERHIVPNLEIGTAWRFGFLWQWHSAYDEGKVRDADAFGADSGTQLSILRDQRNRSLPGRGGTGFALLVALRDGSRFCRDAVVHPSQPGAEPQDQLSGKRGIAAHLVQELMSRQDLCANVRRCAGRRAVDAVLENTHLAQPLAFANVPKHDGVVADFSHHLHFAGADQQNIEAWITLPKEHISLLESAE